MSTVTYVSTETYASTYVSTETYVREYRNIREYRKLVTKTIYELYVRTCTYDMWSEMRTCLQARAGNLIVYTTLLPLYIYEFLA